GGADPAQFRTQSGHRHGLARPGTGRKFLWHHRVRRAPGERDGVSRHAGGGPAHAGVGAGPPGGGPRRRQRRVALWNDQRRRWARRFWVGLQDDYQWSVDYFRGVRWSERPQSAIRTGPRAGRELLWRLYGGRHEPDWERLSRDACRSRHVTGFV